MRYLHTMIRVADPDATIRFFGLLGLKEVRRLENEQGRFTLIFLSTPEDTGIGDRRAEIELTYNWPADGGQAEDYATGRAFGHLAYRVENIYDTCGRLQAAGVTINLPPRDGRMAFVKTPDGISVELLQDGELDPAEPWRSMPNTGSW